MSTENTVPVSPTTQGANPVPKLETRGENDFAKQLETQSTQQDSNAGTTTEKTETVPTKTETVAATVPTPAAKTEATNADIIKSVVEATVAGMTKKEAAVVKQDQRELSDAEFAQKYGIPQINEATMQAILDSDPKKGAAALNNVIQAAVRQALLMGKDIHEGQLNKYRAEVEPDIQSYRAFRKEQAEKKIREDFYGEHKDLVGEEALVDEMTNSLLARVQNGQLKFASQKEANTAVAEACRKILVRVNRTGATQTTTQAGSATASASRQMSAASSAGRSGTGKAQEKSVAEEVFGEYAR